MNQRKIIIITPVKNEAWILKKFIWACSQFADHIVFLDQLSTDETRHIIRGSDKALLFENKSPKYDEAYRTEFLINKVRELYGIGNIIIALDADEIPTFPSLSKESWFELSNLEPGTTIFFEKSDIIPNPIRACRTAVNFPLGYIDDGAEVERNIIHNRRIPNNPTGEIYYCFSIIIMHLARIKREEYQLRQAFYSMVENVNQTKCLFRRYSYYAKRISDASYNQKVPLLPDEWVRGYFEKGIDVFAFKSSGTNEYREKISNFFIEYGYRKFWLDDIWWINWNQEDSENFQKSQKSPPAFLNILRCILIRGFLVLRNLKNLKI